MGRRSVLVVLGMFASRPVVLVDSILYTVYTDRYDRPYFRKGLCIYGIVIRYVYNGSCTLMAQMGLELA